jgi:hypothetical protein
VVDRDGSGSGPPDHQELLGLGCGFVVFGVVGHAAGFGEPTPTHVRSAARQRHQDNAPVKDLRFQWSLKLHLAPESPPVLAPPDAQHDVEPTEARS